MIPRTCRRFREAWSREFDGAAPPLSAGVEHLATCPQCRAFTNAAADARAALRAQPLPTSDPAADLRVLQALRAVEGRRLDVVAAPSGAASVLLWLRYGMGRLLGAGAASFALTLLIALGLSHLPAGDTGDGNAPRGSRPPVGLQDRGYLVNRIELWTGTSRHGQPTPRKATPALPPAESTGDRPGDAEPGRDRAGSRAWIGEVG